MTSDDSKECDGASVGLIESPSKNIHPLKHKWSFWHLESDRNKSWDEKLTKIFTVDNVEDFWRFYLNILPPSKLATGSDYYLFKDGIKPTWEDPANASGGRWIYTLDKQDRKEKLDGLWMQILKILISGQFSKMDDLVCGVAVNLRSKDDKLALWTTKECESDEAKVHIENSFVANLDLPHHLFRYESHPQPEKLVEKFSPPPLDILDAHG